MLSGKHNNWKWNMCDEKAHNGPQYFLVLSAFGQSDWQLDVKGENKTCSAHFHRYKSIWPCVAMLFLIHTLNAFIPCGTINRLTLCKCCSMFGNHFLTHLLVFVHIIFIEVIGLSNFLKYYYFILFKFKQNASLSLL